MFKTSDRASFLIIFFRLLQYYVLVVLNGDILCPFSSARLLPLLHQRGTLHTKLSCTQRLFGNYWASAMLRGPDFIAKLSDGLKIINPIFITSDDIGKLRFVTSLKHLKQLFGHFNPLSVFFSSVNRCGTHLAKMFRTFKCFFKIW